MSGPREPWRSRGLNRDRRQAVADRTWHRFWDQMEGKRIGRDLPEGLASIAPRETRPRDRSLNGKSRRRARKAARS